MNCARSTDLDGWSACLLIFVQTINRNFQKKKTFVWQFIQKDDLDNQSDLSNEIYVVPTNENLQRIICNFYWSKTARKTSERH